MIWQQTSRCRSDQNRRTSRLTCPKRGIARHDRGWNGGAGCHGSECESCAAVTCYDDGGAAGLTDSVAGGTGGCEGEGAEDGEEGCGFHDDGPGGRFDG